MVTVKPSGKGGSYLSPTQPDTCPYCNYKTLEVILHYKIGESKPKMLPDHTYFRCYRCNKTSMQKNQPGGTQ